MARASLNRCGLVVSISKILVVVVVGFGFCGFWVSRSFFGVYKLWVAMGHGLWVGGLGSGRCGFDVREWWDVWVWHGSKFWLWVVVV